MHQKTRDVLVFACYTGLSYIDVKLLTNNNIVRGIDGNYRIYTKREKTDEPVKNTNFEQGHGNIEKI